MPAKFEITRIVSQNVKKNTMQVIVNFQGRSVTRHIKNGVGKHPDDLLPELIAKLEDRISENKKLRSDKTEAITLLEAKKPQGWLDFTAKMQREIAMLDEALPVLQQALETVRKEDPLMVNYF